LWKFHRDAPGGFTIRGDAQPRAAHGSVYAAFADGTVVALQPQTGVAKWTRQVSGTGDYLDVDSIDAPEADDHIYVASAKAGIVALDANTGEPAWTYALAGANHVLVDGPRVIGGGRGELVALDRVTGKKLWTLQLSRDHYPTQPVAMRGLLLVAQDRGALMGVDVQTGHPRGAFDPGSGFSQPAFALPGVAYIVSNGGALYSLGLLP
jgi:outer membrane protein assembly factor BamB